MSLTANSTGKLLGTAAITYGSGSGVSNRELQGSATITYGGAPTSNTALSLPGTSGNYMNLGATHPAHFDTRSSSLFMEAWVYSLAANGSVNQQIVAVTDNSSTTDWNLFIGTDNIVHFGYWAPTYTQVVTGTISFAAWNHVALSWNPTTRAMYVFLNGVASGPITAGTTGVYSAARELHIGSETTGSVFNGYIRDVRILQGGSVPTSTLTPVASAPFGPGTPTYVASMGTPVLSLYTDYFYPSFLTLPGSSGNVMNLGTFFPSKANPSTSNVFVEMWLYPKDANGTLPFTVSDGSSEDMGLLFNYGGVPLQFRVWDTAGSGGNNSTNTGTITINRWYHIAGSWDRTNNKVYGFVNGVVGSGVGDMTGKTARSRSTSNLILGAGNNGTFLPFNGYIQDVRIVQGGIVPTTSFTPGPAPFAIASPSYAPGGATVLALATQYMQKVTTTVKSIPTLLSSISSGAAASAKGIYSLYAVGVSPLVINVRNGTTAATSDFYGDAFGNLTTLSGQSISSWLGAATGFVTTWYDQSGLGNHAAQATTALQPSITLGTPNLINFGGTGYFTIANQVMPTGNGVFTTITKLGTHPTASQIFFWNFGTTGSTGCVGFDLRTDFSPNRYEEFFYGAGDVTGPTYTPNATVSGVYNQSSHTLYLNGAQIGTSAVSSRNGIAGNQTIGAIIWAPADGRGTTLYTGTMRDLYVFSTALSTADRNIMENGYSVTPTRSYGQPLFSQLSTAAASSAVGAYSLRSVNGTTVKVAKVNAKYPTGTFSTYTSIYGVVSASTEYPPGGDNPYAWKAFDGLTTSPNYWASGANYTQGVARTTGTVTVAGGTNYYGDWLQIQLPVSFVPSGYALVAQQAIVNTPGTWYVFGSTDGSTWTLLDTRSGIASSTFTNFVYNTYTITGATTSYNYYRIVCNIVSVNTSFALAEFAILRTSDFWADRLGNLLSAPVTGQPLGDWLQGVTGLVDTWYDQSGTGNHATQANLAIQPRVQRATKGPGYAVYFAGAQYLNGFSYTVLNNTNYTFCAVDRRFSATGGGNAISDLPIVSCGYTATGVANQTMYILYRSSTTFKLGQWANELNSTVTAYNSISEPIKYTYSMTSSTSGMNTYLYNDPLGAPVKSQNLTYRNLLNMIAGSLQIGGISYGSSTSYYIGEIYELIVMTTSVYDTDGTSGTNVPTTVQAIYQNQLSYTGT